MEALTGALDLANACACMQGCLLSYGCRLAAMQSFVHRNAIDGLTLDENDRQGCAAVGHDMHSSSKRPQAMLRQVLELLAACIHL